jgi:uncharacterized protein YuzE
MAGMKIWYDQEGDFLEVSFDDEASVTEEIEPDIFERRTPDGRIVGFAVFNFSKHNQTPLRIPSTVSAVMHAD